MKIISLPHDKIALVDDEDYDELIKYKWHTRIKGRDTTWYVYRWEYIGIENGKKRYRYIAMHRDILKPKKEQCIDHINHNGLDNRRCNIRICDRSQNNFNRNADSKNKTSVYKGVTFYKKCNKWQAQINFRNKYIYIGLYISEIDAAKAYDQKAKELFGEYANLNNPNGVDCEFLSI